MTEIYSDERTWDEIYESCDVNNRDVVKGLAADNFEFFAEHLLGFNTESPLIKEVIDVTQNPPEQPQNRATKLAFMAPRGHSKTFTATIARTLWVCYSESDREVLIVTGSLEQAKDILDSAKRILSRNEALQHLRASVENVEDSSYVEIEKWEADWSKTQFRTTTDVRVKVKPFSSTIRGQQPDYVFCDDLLSDDVAGNRSVEAEKDLFYSAVSPTVESNRGTLQVVGTPRSHNDLLAELMEKDSYYSSRYSAIMDGEVLWPWKWTKEKLMAKKDEIGPSRFAREYMCEPMSKEEQFFPYEKLVGPNLGDEHWKEQHDDWTYVAGVDIALGDSDMSDYTVIVVLGIDPDGGVHMVDAHREKGMTPESITQTLTELSEYYELSRGLVERNAIGMGVWSTIEKADIAGRIEPFDTTRKTRPEILSNLQAALERQDLSLYDVDSVLVDEMLAFKYRGGKLEGKSHDDCVMALAIAYKAATEASSEVTVSVIGSGGELDLDDVDNTEFDNPDRVITSGDADDEVAII